MKFKHFALALLGALALSLGGCAIDYDYSDDTAAPEVASESSALSSDDDPSTEGTYDCYVSIQCANGTTKACSGSNGSCSASSSSNGRVTCNGVTQSCGITQPPSECDSCPFGYSCHCGPFEGCVRDTQHCP
ncbi:hypothetical protein [Haliangium ochraceum]|uniref:hypothetical protein n=1 Tax=Haliangium ochraceum TaxID=80816 RepID=UPI00019BAFA4|nr:hypothetical protein [Haliangium ochraceum]